MASGKVIAENIRRIKLENWIVSSISFRSLEFICTGSQDTGSLSRTCDYCSTDIRRVYTIHNPEHDFDLDVGCVCVEGLTIKHLESEKKFNQVIGMKSFQDVLKAKKNSMTFKFKGASVRVYRTYDITFLGFIICPKGYDARPTKIFTGEKVLLKALKNTLRWIEERPLK